jgi:hypothetical protein
MSVGTKLIKKKWATTEGKQLQRMIWYIRNITRKNGVGAKCPLNCKSACDHALVLVHAFGGDLPLRFVWRCPMVAALKSLVVLRSREAKEDESHTGGGDEIVNVVSDYEEGGVGGSSSSAGPGASATAAAAPSASARTW